MLKCISRKGLHARALYTADPRKIRFETHYVSDGAPNPIVKRLTISNTSGCTFDLPAGTEITGATEPITCDRIRQDVAVVITYATGRDVIWDTPDGLPPISGTPLDAQPLRPANSPKLEPNCDHGALDNRRCDLWSETFNPRARDSAFVVNIDASVLIEMSPSAEGDPHRGGSIVATCGSATPTEVYRQASYRGNASATVHYNFVVACGPANGPTLLLLEVVPRGGSRMMGTTITGVLTEVVR